MGISTVGRRSNTGYEEVSSSEVEVGEERNTSRVGAEAPDDSNGGAV